MKCSLTEWNEFIQSHPDTHLLQSGEWGELKSRFGWQAVRIISGTVGAQVLFRKLPAGRHIGYLGKGPVGGSIEPLMPELDAITRQYRSIFLKVEPDGWQDQTSEDSQAFQAGWIPSKPIQPQRTVMVSLQGSEDEILSRMKQKTRYNIRLAQRKGVTIRADSDLAAFHAMMKQTGERDRFGVHSQAYYQAAYDLFYPSGSCELFTAFYNENPLASLMVFARGKTAWYLYGASSNEMRNLMPTYLLQWQAMLWAKEKGCLGYDLWGIPDMEESTLEDNFTQRESHEGLWGVYRFKRGFGGDILRSRGAYDRVYSSGLYALYQSFTRLRGGNEG